MTNKEMKNREMKNMSAIKTIRVVMFPWLGYGHITPYLELAKKLATRNFTIYICSTPATLSCIENKIPDKLSKSIVLLPLTLPSLPGLPPELHTTNGLPHDLMPTLKEAFDLSAPTFAKILKKRKPNLLIYDFLQPWAPLIAEKQNIPAVEFITSSSTMTSFMFHYFNKPGVDFPYPKIYFRDYEKSNLKKLVDIASNPEEREMASQGVSRSCKIVLIKGFRGMEGKYIDYVTDLVGKKFVPVGSLVQDPSPDEINGDMLSYLNNKERKSTVFVSFGSEYFLTKEDMDELAYGLEISHVNFIWVIRFPKGQNGHVMDKTLPNGFLDRIGNRGMVVEGWAPQTKILGHENIGGFVSHCGWNSVLESMNFGVPIIAVPMHLDQPINARLVEEVGIGVEVVRDGNRKLCRHTIAAVIKQVVSEDSGAFVRKRVNEIRDNLMVNKDQEIDEVVKELAGLCFKN